MSVRKANESDIISCMAFDPVRDEQRHLEIRAAINAGWAWVYDDGGVIKGYIIINNSFFHHFFIPLIIVDDKVCGQGIGKKMIEHIECHCGGQKIFTSTNKSNVSAQKFFEKCGFSKAGYIEGLDDADPEIFFMKESLLK